MLCSLLFLEKIEDAQPLGIFYSISYIKNIDQSQNSLQIITLVESDSCRYNWDNFKDQARCMYTKDFLQI